MVEAALMLYLMRARLQEGVSALSSLGRGLLAAVIGGASTYLLALYLPGGAIITAIIGMALGAVIALVIIRKEVRLLFNL